MKRKSRHSRHVALLKKLVEKTDYYVAFVWNKRGQSMYGEVDSDNRQKFRRYGNTFRVWFTPYLTHSPAGKVYFAVMPQKKSRFGIVLEGWTELKWFVGKEMSIKENSK